MNKLRYFFISNSSLSTTKIFIRNTDLPICSKCIHFIEHKKNYPYDPVPNDRQYGKCNKFGEINFISGSIDYDLAKHCRDDNNKCGKNGSEYKEKIIVINHNANFN